MNSKLSVIGHEKSSLEQDTNSGPLLYIASCPNHWTPDIGNILQKNTSKSNCNGEITYCVIPLLFGKKKSMNCLLNFTSSRLKITPCIQKTIFSNFATWSMALGNTPTCIGIAKNPSQWQETTVSWIFFLLKPLMANFVNYDKM